MRLRIATAEDLPEVFALYDAAVEWLVSIGRTDQWGSEPYSANPHWASVVQSRVNSGRTWLAQDGTLLGVVTLRQEPPPYIEPLPTPEIYVSGLITSRRPQARGMGKVLLDHARRTALAEGARILRLDCYAGGDGKLVDYYLSHGFTRVRRIAVDFDGTTYNGQLLEQRLSLVDHEASVMLDGVSRL